jgi:hypothetical protein
VFLQNYDTVCNRQRIVSRLVFLQIPVQVGSTEGDYEFSRRISSPVLQRRFRTAVSMKGYQQVARLICTGGFHPHPMAQPFQHPPPANRRHLVATSPAGLGRNHDLNPPYPHIRT